MTSVMRVFNLSMSKELSWTNLQKCIRLHIYKLESTNILMELQVKLT